MVVFAKSEKVYAVEKIIYVRNDSGWYGVNDFESLCFSMYRHFSSFSHKSAQKVP